jgi:hypothetical protein
MLEPIEPIKRHTEANDVVGGGAVSQGPAKPVFRFFIDVAANHFVELVMKQWASEFIASQSDGEALPMLQSAISIIY